MQRSGQEQSRSISFKVILAALFVSVVIAFVLFVALFCMNATVSNKEIILPVYTGERITLTVDSKAIFQVSGAQLDTLYVENNNYGYAVINDSNDKLRKSHTFRYLGTDKNGVAVYTPVMNGEQ